jgi:hypothetical protein
MDSNRRDHDESTSGSSLPPDPDVVARESGKFTPERQRAARVRQRQPSQRHNRGPPSDDEPVSGVADDVLLGAQRIAAHLTAILGVPTNTHDVYYASRMRKLPIGKYGALLIASKHQIARHFEQIARGSVA